MCAVGVERLGGDEVTDGLLDEIELAEDPWCVRCVGTGAERQVGVEHGGIDTRPENSA